MKKDKTGNPKEEKKVKEVKVTPAKETAKKTDKKEEVKPVKTITKKTGTETKINIHKKDDVKKEDDTEDSSKKSPVKIQKTTVDPEKKEFGSAKQIEEEIIPPEKEVNNESSNNLIKISTISEISNDSKALSTINSNATIELKDSLAIKEKEINQLKQSMNEKKQTQDDMNKIIKESNQLKKDKIDLNATIEQLNKDNEMFSNELSTLLEENEKLVKGNLDLTSKLKEFEENNKNVDMLEDFENLKIDYEIKNEECEGLKLELANAKTEKIMDLDPESEKARIFELEQNVKATENALLKLDEQKSNEIYKLQKELKDKNEKAKNADLLPKKEEEIRLLSIKLEDYEISNKELREQLSVFSGASSMMDDLINQKLNLEMELEKERREKDDLNVEIDTSEQLMQEYENAQKISADIIREKENNIIELNNTLMKLKNNSDDSSKKEENMIKSYNVIKNENQILKDEIGKNKNVNVDQILNKNSNIHSKLKTYMRRSVLEKLLDTDLTLQKFKYVVITEMIPRQVIDKGGYESFDKYLLLVSIRKKICYLLFNIIENDLLRNENTDNEKSIEEENSKYFSFLKNLINTLIDLSNLCLNLEIVFGNLAKNDFRTLSKASLWNNVIAAAKILENLANTIKADNFSIKFQFEPIKIIIKVIQEEAKSNLKINLEEERNPICCYNYEILKYLSNIMINYNTEKEIDATIIKVVNNLYKQVKKTLKKIDEKFVYNFSQQAQVFELENSYYLKFLEGNNLLFDNNFENKLQKYEALSEPLIKLCIILMNYLEKLEKEEMNKENENKLPLNTWTELCLEVKTELEESVKTKSKLDNSILKLDEIKLEKMQLESKIEDFHRNKLVNDKKLAESLLIAGKVPQLEEQINEFKRKIEKYNTTIDNLRENLEIESSKAKNLQLKVDNTLPSNPLKKVERGGANRRGIMNIDQNSVASMSIGSNNLMTDSIPLLNTICDLQKERKYLKSKLMKEKLEDLLGENSYINRYIEKVSKLNHQEEKEKLLKIETEMEDLNKNYKYVRMKLCTPKILDLSSKEYNFEKSTTKQENKTAKLRVNYLSNIDKIMYNLFGDNSLDKTFKETIDNDITKILSYLSEKKLLVGKISFQNNELSNAPTNNVPVYLSETSLKLLNKTFLN